MSVLVIGGDNLGSLTEHLRIRGFEKINHVTGRKKRDCKVSIPNNTDLVLVLTDYVGHQLTKQIKESTKDTKAEIMYSKRSWIHMQKSIEEFLAR